MLAAIILAAGDSTRMGTPKALLPDSDGRPFVARIVRTFVAAGVSHVFVVTGRQHAAIVEALRTDRPSTHPTMINNPEPSRGQVSSFLVGLEAAECPDLEGVLMALVDVPMVRAATIRLVIDAWARNHAPVVRPAVGERHGHPVLFDRAVFDELRHAPFTEGARAVVHAHAEQLVNVPVDDEGCLIDIDTPGDYDAIVKKSVQS